LAERCHWKLISSSGCMKHGCVCGAWLLTGLVVIPRDDWRLA
jgi:hypothetical protein